MPRRQHQEGLGLGKGGQVEKVGVGSKGVGYIAVTDLFPRRRQHQDAPLPYLRQQTAASGQGIRAR